MTGKNNLTIWGGVTVALVLVAGGGRCLYSKWKLNNETLDQLKQQYAQMKAVEDKNAQMAANTGAGGTASVEKQAPRLNITFRAIGIDRVSPGADQEIALNVLSEIRNSAYFDASETKASDISAETSLSDPAEKAGPGAPPGTFSFKVVAKLKRPLTL